MTADMEALATMWLVAKEAEREAIERRRSVEDRIKTLSAIPDGLEGTKTIEQSGFTIKITGRIDRKVDADKVQELAAEYGLTEHLAHLFRWKPEINLLVWRATDEAITKPLAAAITAKPGRPSFAITKTET